MIIYDVSVRSPVPQPSRGLPPLANTTPVWRRSWIAIAHAEEVPDNTPVQVLAGGDAWVVTRMDGTLTAFDDCCPHRQAPLSAGAVTRAGDGSPRLTCAVHGWRFDAAGQCDLMPGIDDATAGRHGHRGGHGAGHRHHGWHARHGGRAGQGDLGSRDLPAMLRPAYGITERYGLVWLAADEPLAPLPPFPEWDDDTVARATCQSLTIRASAGQVIEGFLDAQGDEVTTDGWQVTGVSRAASQAGDTVPAQDTVPARRATKTAGPNATAHLRLELPRATIGILVTCQPEDWGTTRVYKLITHSGLAGDAAAMEKFTRDENQILAGNLAALDRFASPLLPLDPPAGGEAGRLNIAWRRLMARAIAGG
jgi:phenylpropionate dioxygenase-like ring-hydroxylating dioxygenase large terminal subunit